jgi:hypothetical protein
MFISVQGQHASYAWLFRWCGRAGGAMVVIAWLALVILEATRPDVGLPSVEAIYQGAALALVFAGYALGWRQELAGGVLTIVGTVAFFAVNLLTLEVLPDLGATWFAIPGVLYLLAWKTSERGREMTAQP